MCDFLPPGSYSFLQQQTHVEALRTAGGINIHIREASFFESRKKKQPKEKKKRLPRAVAVQDHGLLLPVA